MQGTAGGRGGFREPLVQRQGPIQHLAQKRQVGNSAFFPLVPRCVKPRRMKGQLVSQVQPLAGGQGGQGS
jgi:hypothetical protein